MNTVITTRLNGSRIDWNVSDNAIRVDGRIITYADNREELAVKLKALVRMATERGLMGVNR